MRPPRLVVARNGTATHRGEERNADASSSTSGGEERNGDASCSGEERNTDASSSTSGGEERNGDA